MAPVTAPVQRRRPPAPGPRVPNPRATRRAVRRRANRRRKLTPYALLLPALVLELAIHIIPMAVGVWMSLKGLTQFYLRDWSRAPYRGLSNYRIALDVSGPIGADLLHSLVITAVFTALAVGLSWVFGTAAAVLLQRPFAGRAVLRTLFLTPYALPAYAAVITWSFLLQRDTGLLNHVLVDQLHLTNDRPFWLIGTNSFISLVAVSVWRTWPFALLCVTAGLQTIPTEMYEAATIDGAGFARQIRLITLPMLAPVNKVLVLVLVLWTFNDFSTPYVLFGAAAPRAADLISIHIYQSSFVTWNFGLGSAMSVLLLLFLLIVTVAYLAITSRRRSNAA